MAKWSDILGTFQTTFRLGLTGVRIKSNSGVLEARNTADNAYVPVAGSRVDVTGDTLVINSDAANTGADRSITLARPATGMGASYTLTLPVDDGSPSQVLSTDGSGNTSWVSAGATADKDTVDTTSLAFGATSPVALFTLPANAVISTVQVIVDTPFNGTPSLSVGIAGTTSKYMGTSQVDLTAPATTVFEVDPGVAPVGTTENLIATYSAGSASAGAARILVNYAIPS